MRILKFSFLLSIFLISFNCISQEGNIWLNDFSQAKKEAKEKDKPILAKFEGSDWCSYCQKLQKNVFSKEVFKDYAKKHFVLFKADFPRNKELSPEVEKQNKRLAKKYNVRGFPTILILDENGKVMERTGYKPGGPQKYVHHLQELLNMVNNNGDEK